MSTAERFWANVHIGDLSECWPWTGGQHNEHGYGAFYHDGVKSLAHRFAYGLAYGGPPYGMVVRHVCDNPPCCNPSHLLLGDQAANVRDMIDRHRHVPPPQTAGAECSWAKLTDNDVVEIRRLRDGGVPIAVVAARFGVSKATISRAHNGLSFTSAKGR